MKNVSRELRVSRQNGFSLIELMISLVLGLVVVAAAGGVFLSNKRIYGATETTGRIQENQRAAFELMARDIREAAGSPCAATRPPVNMLQSGGNAFWSQFPNGMSGTNGGGASPDSLDLYMGNDGEIEITSHDNPAAVLDVSANADVAVGDILMACNADVSIVFEVTQLPAANKIQHNGGGSTGNCGQEFQHRHPDLSKCAGASQDFGYCFVIPPGGHPNPGCTRIGQGPASVVRVTVVRWEVRDNGRNGGRSLYRTVYRTNGTGVGTPISTAEVAEGITDLQLKYQSDTGAAFQDAPVADWKRVVAVQMNMRAVGVAGAQQGEDIQGTDRQVLSRVMTSTVALRNREALL
jgi:type IV pilus assembly protein PilW